MIIATAGHVDHGKTALLRAITGISGDRLPEEKRRGMTIDLGYAFLPLEDGTSLGFIDVPGHEKFLTNMLAGVGGVQHALLVIACDDGIMPQTREHLAILRRLNIASLTVALTKADLSTDLQREELKRQVAKSLEQYGWQSDEIYATSVMTGVGIEKLRQRLIQLRQDMPIANQRFRLAIDRAFTIKGSGLVVTGTAFSGSVAVGDSLWLTGSQSQVRVRSLHAQNREANDACAGQRIAINLVGNISKRQIERGDWLLSNEPPPPVDRVVALLSSDKPIHHWQSVHIHHAASHTTGRVSLLEQKPYQADGDYLAELILDAKLFLAENDRLIIRDISAKETLGGARIIELRPPRRGKRKAESLDKMSRLSRAESHEAALRLRLDDGPLSISDFGWSRQLSAAAVKKMLLQLDCLTVGDIALRDDIARRFQDDLMVTLAQFHQQHSDQLGVGRSRLKRMALPTQPDAIIFVLIDGLIAEKRICNNGGWLHLPEHNLAFDDRQQAVWDVIKPLFDETPLWVRDIASATNLDEDRVRQTLRKAARLGFVTAIIKDRYFLHAQIQQFAELIRLMDATAGMTNAADFRDRLGIGRKLAIQILEFFDKTGFTRRKGNQHILRDDGLFKG